MRMFNVEAAPVDDKIRESCLRRFCHIKRQLSNHPCFSNLAAPLLFLKPAQHHPVHRHLLSLFSPLVLPHLSRQGCMADPEVDHGLILNSRGEIDSSVTLLGTRISEREHRQGILTVPSSLCGHCNLRGSPNFEILENIDQKSIVDLTIDETKNRAFGLAKDNHAYGLRAIKTLWESYKMGAGLNETSALELRYEKLDSVNEVITGYAESKFPSFIDTKRNSALFLSKNKVDVKFSMEIVFILANGMPSCKCSKFSSHQEKQKAMISEMVGKLTNVVLGQMHYRHSGSKFSSGETSASPIVLSGIWT
ncbi:hypothetical protein KFK09_012058 [Dendrobium nobile]|uniref:Uncharacterized protein n=1 Tax=Dendrobium nobile TaxID=94219 RepID=A0A8T3BJT4_DENNO|nr:hypothetical protein KFK09_012058 [Dendrobium nobile]